MEALAAAGVPYEVVPGVSSVLAAPAAAGIPLTHRGVASSVAIATAVCTAPGRLSSALGGGASADTLVVLMGLSALDRVAAELMEHGRRADTPVAVISRATLPGQSTVVATLATVASVVAEAGLESPGLMVVGEVVRLRERLQRHTELNDAPTARAGNGRPPCEKPSRTLYHRFCGVVAYAATRRRSESSMPATTGSMP
jgi:siroheme synthase